MWIITNSAKLIEKIEELNNSISWNVDINDLWPNWLYYTSWATTLAAWWSDTLSFPKWTLLIINEWDWSNRELTSIWYVYWSEEVSDVHCWIIDPDPIDWWSDLVSDFSMYQINPSNFLSKYNSDSYTPTWNYNPATKKYVDDAVAWAIEIVYCTQAEYDALPNTKLTDWKSYFIYE